MVSIPHPSLNDRIPWHQVLEALRLPVPSSQALPALSACPACKSSCLMILQDHLAGGQWHWCRNCHAGGDMIELAARVWRLPIPQTISKLNSLGLPIEDDRELSERYARQHVAARRQHAELWRTASRNFVRGDSAGVRLAHSLRLACDVSHERLAGGLGQLVGLVDPERVQRTLAPRAKQKIFQGTKTNRWGEVVTLPFYDLPRRICGFLFVGRSGRPDKDFIFRRTNIATKSGDARARHIREAGLFLHPDILDLSAEWGNTVVALADPVRAAQIQARHLRSALRPLPLVAWYPSDALSVRYAWKMLAGRRIVIWAPTITHQVVQQAILTGASISTIGPDRNYAESLDEYVWKRMPRELLGNIKQSAIPWPQAVARHFQRIANNEAESLLLELRMNGVDLQKLLERCPVPLRQRLTDLVDYQPVGRTVHMERKTIIEKSDGWYIEGGRAGEWELVLDAQLRLDYLIWQEKSRRALYRGRLIQQGIEFPFCADKQLLDRKPLDFLNELLMPHGHCLTCAPRWASRLTTIAQQLHKPQVIQGSESVGWDAKQLAFVLPKYRIKAGGGVDRNLAMFPEGAPGEHFTEPEPLSGEELHKLLPASPLSEQLWGAATTLLANILAPACNQKTVGVGVVGPNMVDVARDVAEDFGCPPRRLEGKNNEAVAEMQREEASHAWPTWVDYAPGSKRIRQFVDETRASHPHRNCVLRLDWYTAMLKLLMGNWCVLESVEPTTLPQEIRAVLRRVVPAYLRDVTKRNFEWGDGDSISGNGIWWETVAADMANWLDRFGVDGSRVHDARRVRRDPQADALADLTSQLVTDRQWLLVPDGFQEENKPSLLRLGDEVFGAEAVAVPKEALARWAAKRGITLDGGKVSTLLQREDRLLADQDEHWIVPGDWWMHRMKLTRNERTGLLRLRA